MTPKKLFWQCLNFDSAKIVFQKYFHFINEEIQYAVISIWISESGTTQLALGQERESEKINLAKEKIDQSPGNDLVNLSLERDFFSKVTQNEMGEKEIIFAVFSKNKLNDETVNLLKELCYDLSALIKINEKTKMNQLAIQNQFQLGQDILNLEEKFDENKLSNLLRRILETSLSSTKTSHGVVLLLDELSGELIIESEAVSGNLIDKAPKRLVRRKDRPNGIVYKVLDDNSAYISGEVDADSNYTALFKGIHSSLAVPIRYQNRCIGVIVVESERQNAFGPKAESYLTGIAQAASVFIRRAMLYELSKENSEEPIMIKGTGPDWAEVEKRVERASRTKATVILRGESGTGKELIARSIHFNSARVDKPMVIVNCAAIPKELLESTLFGHSKGAFTGATYDKTGEFEKADGGTIFLDEIGDLEHSIQVKLLRVLQFGEIQKVGAQGLPKKVNVRVIAATSRDLEAMMKEERFREDLYYRLQVVPIFLPPLRNYKNVLPKMVQSILSQLNSKYNLSIKGISNEALNQLSAYSFPGNVRQLRNILEQAIIMEDAQVIHESSLPKEIFGNEISSAEKDIFFEEKGEQSFDFKKRKDDLISSFEKSFASSLLAHCNGNFSKAAKLSSLGRASLYKLCERHNLNAEDYRGD